jgi:hypothetical protein|tara:strand:- start:468 stop:692 length:225 start_codon:yes stop_codon:yes gene_type:complete
VLPHIGINPQLFTTIHYVPLTSDATKIDKMIEGSDLGCSLKVSMTNMNIKHPASDNDVCFAVRPNLVKFSDLQF